MVKTKISQSAKIKQLSSQVRPPVVTVLGHIDHGKTTLLDFIRKENIAQKESGGITQHIGAYQAKVKIGKEEKLITFIDTPGHEAFFQMRSRGANVADIAILVISAKDGVMPQTKESIAYIKKAKIPLLVAINKIDVFNNKAERKVAVIKIEKQLKKLDIVVEKEGGEVVCLAISAKTGENIEDLLEMLALLFEMKGVKTKKDMPLQGVVIDSRIDRQKGILATVLVREGNLKIKDKIQTENIQGKVKALFNESGKQVKMAGPSTPVQVLGFDKAPLVGGIVTALIGSRQSQSIKPLSEPKYIENIEEEISMISEKKKDNLKVILKTDTLGTKEAILAAFDEKVEVISSEIGDISESDVFLARTSQTPILGFKVNISSEIKKLAQNEGVKIKTYQIIYRLLEEIDEIMKFLKEGKEEKLLGKGEIIDQFEMKKNKIAGVRVLEGRIARGDKIKILRGEEEIGQGRITTLRQGKDDVTKVEMGEECGIGFSKKLDFEVEDVVKSIG
ncbi:translation initiation factor IF-2 [Candidatus Microgenomates bacterium]|nr:translation initiation factor IF-2 [Candidatus Microgenomates bacterium]